MQRTPLGFYAGFMKSRNRAKPNQPVMEPVGGGHGGADAAFYNRRARAIRANHAVIIAAVMQVIHTAIHHPQAGHAGFARTAKGGLCHVHKCLERKQRGIVGGRHVDRAHVLINRGVLIYLLRFVGNTRAGL